MLALISTLVAPALGRAAEGRAPGEPAAAGAASGDATAFPLQYSETELAEIVTAVAERTGVRLIFDDRLRGRVTITAPRPVRGDEAIALLISALRLTGFATLSAPGGGYAIVPLADSAGRVDYSPSTPRAFIDAPVTTLVPLRAAQAEALLPMIQPLLGQNAVVQAFAPTNTLILSATEAQLHRALAVIRALDRAEARQLLVLRPRFRGAEELLPMIQAAFPESRRASESLRISAEGRSNALLVEGPADLVKEVRAFLDSVDLPTPGQGGIHVVRIRHADAEEMAEVIQQAATATPGSTTPVGAPPDSGMSADALVGHDFGLSVDKATNSLVLRSDAETLRVLARLIATLDVDVPSVSVKTTLFEVRDTDSLDVSIDALVPFARPANVGSDTGFVYTRNSGDTSLLTRRPSDARDAFRLLYFSEASGYGVDVKATATEGDARLLSEPQIVAQSGEEQEIFVGNNVPIISATNTSAAGGTAGVASAGTVSSADPLQISQNIERQDVGVRLRVKPTVPSEGPVRLELRIEFSALTVSLAGAVTAVGPTLIKQSVETTVYLDDGAGAVVGMRGEPIQIVERTGTPWLMDIPALSWLFGSVSTMTERKDLVIAIQVKVIRSPEDLELESIRRRVALERSVAGLERLPVSPEEAPFAVWVATTNDRESAEALAAGLDLGARRAEVVAWRTEEPRRFDVYVLGFDRFADAMKTNLEVKARGYDPEVVALPGRE